jgi:DNA-binding transcriptional LysR family regulator
MEMHQIRYFLSVARTLNFTRAAEECHVAQPSLTRAIKLLEEELGGDLFRRERNLSHLTELGQRMLPLVQQCYESALSAKSLATAIKSGKVAPLRLALSRTIPIELLLGFLTELARSFKGLELRFVRGTGPEVAESLKKGDAELAVAGPLSETWERLDCWPLFVERFSLMVGKDHHLAGRNAIDLADLANERLLVRTYCELADQLATVLHAAGAGAPGAHEIVSERDLAGLLEAGLGVCVAPDSTARLPGVERVVLRDCDLSRTVYLYAVAGRPRSAVAATLIKLLRSADWAMSRG